VRRGPSARRRPRHRHAAERYVTVTEDSRLTTAAVTASAEVETEPNHCVNDLQQPAYTTYLLTLCLTKTWH